MRNTGFADGYSTQDPVTAVSWGVGRGFEDKLNEGEWTRKVEITTRKKKKKKKNWQWAKHAWPYSDLLKALEGERLSALGSQQRGH